MEVPEISGHSLLKRGKCGKAGKYQGQMWPRDSKGPLELTFCATDRLSVGGMGQAMCSAKECPLAKPAQLSSVGSRSVKGT